MTGRRTGWSPVAEAHVGGIDFGFRNPFAAVWGFVDRDDVLWLTGEHYARQRLLSFHAEKLPPNVIWYADPSGANEIAELHCAGFTVRKGNNSLRTGIAAVTARLESGTLRVLEGACPNLLAEAGMYCYGDNASDRQAEKPVDENNHALAALRYLIARLDAHRHVRRLKVEAAADDVPKPSRQGLDEHDERWWLPLN